MCKYEIDPTKAGGATERKQDAGRTDGQMDVLEKTQMYCDENKWRFFCLLRIIQESGVHQLGVLQGQGDSSEGRLDGRTETNIPPNNFVVRGV